MKNGDYVYYTIQHRTTHESPWLKPKGPLKPVKLDDWAFSNWDYFGYVAIPWGGVGNNYKPLYRQSYEETVDVWNETGKHGWWTLKYAEQALQRLKNADSLGAFDSKSVYGTHQQAYRHEFRLVKMTISQKTQVVKVLNKKGKK